jgi:hypothetical protein
MNKINHALRIALAEMVIDGFRDLVQSVHPNPDLFGYNFHDGVLWCFASDFSKRTLGIQLIKEGEEGLETLGGFVFRTPKDSESAIEAVREVLGIDATPVFDDKRPWRIDPEKFPILHEVVIGEINDAHRHGVN